MKNQSRMEVNFSKLVLEKLKGNITVSTVSEHPIMIQNLSVDQRIDRITNGFLYHFKWDILADKCFEKDIQVCFKSPLNWWEHFKEQHAPNWFIKKWPVRYKTHFKWVKIQNYRTFPHANIAIEKTLGQSYILQIYSIEDIIPKDA